MLRVNSYRTYNKIGAHNIIDYINSNQDVSVRVKNMGEYREVIFNGKVSELLKWENRDVMDTLEFYQLLSITIEGSILVIGVA
jgi:hypothetical protein